MPNQRPDPKVLKRKLADIKLRYDAQARDAKRNRHHNRSRGIAAIRLAELTRWFEDAHGAGIELEPEDFTIVYIFAHHLGALNDAPRRINDWIRSYAPWISPHQLEKLILETELKPRRWTADKLGWKIGLTEEQRVRLKIRTIGAKGVNKDMRLIARRKARAEREKARRARAKAAKAVASI
jgi:hypothetical protein